MFKQTLWLVKPSSLQLHKARSLRHTRALYINTCMQPTSTVILFLAKSDKISRRNV